MDPNTSWHLSKLQVAVIQTVSGTFTEIPLKFSFSLAGQRAGRNLSQLLWRGQRSSQRKTCRNHPLGNSVPFTVSSHKRALQSVTKSTDARKVPSCIQVWAAARLAHRLTKSAGWAALQQTAFCTLCSGGENRKIHSISQTLKCRFYCCTCSVSFHQTKCSVGDVRHSSTSTQKTGGQRSGALREDPRSVTSNIQSRLNDCLTKSSSLPDPHGEPWAYVDRWKSPHTCVCVCFLICAENMTVPTLTGQLQM